MKNRRRQESGGSRWGDPEDAPFVPCGPGARATAAPPRHSPADRSFAKGDPRFTRVVTQADRMAAAAALSTSMTYWIPEIRAASGVRAAMSSRAMYLQENFRLPAISCRSPWASLS
jgi:hypothetical protein